MDEQAQDCNYDGTCQTLLLRRLMAVAPDGAFVHAVLLPAIVADGADAVAGAAWGCGAGVEAGAD